MSPSAGNRNDPAPWLSVIGLGDEGLAGLSPIARTLLDEAEVLVGGQRHLDLLPPDDRPRLAWPKPFEPLCETLQSYRPKPVCVLATGDPSCHGVGSILRGHFPAVDMRIVPAPSAYSLACARLGWALQNVDTLSLHGRALERLHPFVQPGARLLLLSENGDTPGSVARLLCQRGFGRSIVTVLAHMGGDKESVVECRAGEWPDDGKVAALNTVAVECTTAPDPDAMLLPRSPGLPDDAFTHDGKMTKSEVRAVTLAALGPVAGQRLWDVGAGCGSVAIEWLRHDPRCRAHAIENTPERIAMMRENALSLGAVELDIREGEAPAALAGLPGPDAVFIGGGVADPGVLPACWDALPSGGRLVANAVTLEGEARLFDWHARHGGRLIQLSINRAVGIGRFRGWRPAMPVTQYAVTKGTDHG